MTYINEHLPIVLASSLEFFVFLTVLIAVFAFTDSKITLSNAFLIFGLLIMTIMSRRNVFLLIPLTSVQIVKLIDMFIKKNTINVNYDQVTCKILKVSFIIICLVIIGICIYNFAISYNEPYIDESLYPVEATKWIKNNLDLDNIKLFNDYDYGSYMLWQGVPVFIDSRCDLYTKPFNKGVTIFDDYMSTYTGEIAYMDTFEKYGITHIITYKISGINTYMSQDENCEQLYEDDNFVVYKYNAE